MRKYLAEAQQDPEANKLYIEDLLLSIAFFENAEREAKDAQRFHIPNVEVLSGFEITG